MGLITREQCALFLIRAQKFRGHPDNGADLLPSTSQLIRSKQTRHLRLLVCTEEVGSRPLWLLQITDNCGPDQLALRPADETNGIVIDCGSSTTRAGYAGEDTPEALFPSVGRT